MSVGGVGAGAPQYTIRQTGDRSAGAASGSPDPSQHAVSEYGDSVEISQEARDLLDNPPPAEPRKPWSIMEYETPLVRGSEEEEKFRELMRSVKSQKSALMSRIEDIFKQHGISQKDYGKVKIEVDSSGRIVVGGVKDPKTAKAIEEALNSEKGLGGSLLQFRNDEKELSRQMRKYSGCSLYELTMTQQGDISKRIRDQVEEAAGDGPLPGDAYYTGLGFLGENLNHVAGSADIAELAFQGSIDFSGETNTLAEPERAIKAELEEMNRKIREEVEEYNAAVKERLEAEGVNVEKMSAEMKAEYLLDAAGIRITVDNLGTVTIEGTFSTNEENNKRGEAIAKRHAFDMLNKTEDNSYHINIFAAASKTLIDRMTDEVGEEKMGRDARVVAEIAGGVAGDIRVSSPQTEARLQKSIQDSVNRIVKDAGIAVSEPLQVEVDENGRIRATNLFEGAEETRQIQALLDQINEDAAKSGKEKLHDQEEEGNPIAGYLAKLKKVREG